jgi:hypothetical protein
MIDSATGKPKPHGWCGNYQCVHNPIYMTRYDMYYNLEMEEEADKAMQKTKDAIASQEPIPEPPPMTLEELNKPSPTAQQYVSPAEILKQLGLKTQEVKRVTPSNVVPEEAINYNLQLIEKEKNTMEEEIGEQTDIRMLQHVLKDAEEKGYVDVAIKAQKKINSLSNLANLRK